MRELGHQWDDVHRAADHGHDLIDRSVLDDIAGDNHFDPFVRSRCRGHAARRDVARTQRSFRESRGHAAWYLPARDGRAVAAAKFADD